MFQVNLEKCLRIFDEVYVSSDSEEILEQSIDMGAVGIKRGEDLCGDTPNIPVYQHALKHMKDAEAIVAVQANSPTVDANLIVLTKKLLEMGVEEIMTCDEKYEIYGSIWAMTANKLRHYGDPYNPKPEVLLKDLSTDVHTIEDLERAIMKTT